MARKKKPEKKLHDDPFSTLKGFVVSESKGEDQVPPGDKIEEPETCEEDLFAREMSLLGVKQSTDGQVAQNKQAVSGAEASSCESPSDEEQFLQAMEEMSVRCKDLSHDDEEHHYASPRRMKLLRQGRLKPEATLDLHGILRQHVVNKVRFFLQDQQYQGNLTLVIVTGRGLHSQGEPVIRAEVERFLREEGRSLVAEWGRAPRQYGGQGALILFLKD